MGVSVGNFVGREVIGSFVGRGVIGSFVGRDVGGFVGSFVGRGVIGSFVGLDVGGSVGCVKEQDIESVSWHDQDFMGCSNIINQYSPSLLALKLEATWDTSLA